MPPLKERLKEILIKNKLITPQLLDEAIKIQKKKGGSLREILIEAKFVDEKSLSGALSQGLNIPTLDLSKYKLDPNVVSLIPKEVARRYQIMPISKIGKVLTVAIADPLNIITIDELRLLTGFEINPIIAPAKDIFETLERYYGESVVEAVEGIFAKMNKEDLEIIKEEQDAFPRTQQIKKLIQEAPVVKITNMLLTKGVRMRASDILIEPLEKTTNVRYRVDGLLVAGESLPRYMHDSIVSRIKVMAELDISEHRLPQDGRFKIRFENRQIDFRVSVLPSTTGEKVALRVLDKSQAMLDIDKLGFQKDMLETLKNASQRPHGMILVCGPTGSGKTTTLYSILKFIDAPEKNIITVEDPIEYQLEGINQVNIRPEIGLDFAYSLRSILRQDPDIIMVGEIRDFETVDIAIKAALTGHLVLSTLHTTTAAGSITRLLDMGVEPFLITSSVIAVVSQRLVRKICNTCKEKYRVSKKIIEQLGLQSLITEENYFFYRGKGCNSCLNTGFKGRVAIGEILLISPLIKELILKRAQEHLIKEQAQKEKMRSLIEDGISKVLAGITTIEEVLRVISAG